MANVKISELTALAEGPASDDLLAIVDTSTSTTKKITISYFYGNLTSGYLPYAAVTTKLLTNSPIYTDGTNVGIGTTSPTAKLHLPASTAAANTASLKIDPGVVATTPVSGNIESDGTNLYWTDSGGVRRQLSIGESLSVSKSTAYTILGTDNYSTFFISGNTTLTLPAASTKRVIKFAKTDSAATIATIARAGSDTIQGATSLSLNNQYDTTTLESDGTSTWYIF